MLLLGPLAPAQHHAPGCPPDGRCHVCVPKHKTSWPASLGACTQTWLGVSFSGFCNFDLRSMYFKPRKGFCAGQGNNYLKGQRELIRNGVKALCCKGKRLPAPMSWNAQDIKWESAKVRLNWLLQRMVRKIKRKVSAIYIRGKAGKKKWRCCIERMGYRLKLVREWSKINASSF